jgi:hypothetical protein
MASIDSLFGFVTKDAIDHSLVVFLRSGECAHGSFSFASAHKM